MISATKPSDNKNPGVFQANARIYVVEGTGAYNQATGLLHSHGELNVVTLEGGIDFKGPGLRAVSW